MANILGIHHISMKCSSDEELRRTLAFYRDLLGLPVVRQWANGCLLDTGSGMIEIFFDGNGPLPQGVLRHFAFRVDSADEMAAKVSAAGYHIFMGPKSVNLNGLEARVAFCTGPLGEDVEFFQEVNT